MGDAALADPSCDMDVCSEDIGMYFECARQIEADLERLSPGGINVVWYVLSDCMGVRERAKSLFGDKVSTPVPYPVLLYTIVLLFVTF